MTKERWEELKREIKNKFEITDEYREDLEPGEADVVEFNGPMGQIKVRYVTKPKLLDKKTTYSNRVGSGVKVDYVFSDSEVVSHVEAYILSPETNEWQKIEAQTLF